MTKEKLVQLRREIEGLIAIHPTIFYSSEENIKSEAKELVDDFLNIFTKKLEEVERDIERRWQIRVIEESITKKD